MVFSCFEIVFESFLSLTANPVETRVSKAITPVSGTPISRPTLLKETAGTLDDRRADMTPLVTDVDASDEPGSLLLLDGLFIAINVTLRLLLVFTDPLQPEIPCISRVKWLSARDDISRH